MSPPFQLVGEAPSLAPCQHWALLPGCFFIFHFIYLFLATLGITAAHWLSPSCDERGFSVITRTARHCRGLSRVGSVERGLSSCRTRALEHRLRSCGRTGFCAPPPVGSSQIRD